MYKSHNEFDVRQNMGQVLRKNNLVQNWQSHIVSYLNINNEEFIVGMIGLFEQVLKWIYMDYGEQKYIFLILE